MHTMVVELYATIHGYGFCVGEGLPRVFFRIEDFQREPGDQVLPVSGEPVVVEGWGEGEPSPRASMVRRLTSPTLKFGKVKSFDSRKGWGFIEASEGDVLFLHRSDMVQPFTPVIGNEVRFYSGVRRGKLRACHVSPSESSAHG